MKTLVLNCGSSSLKYQLISTEVEDGAVVVQGSIEKIGTSKAVFTYHPFDKTEFRDTLEVKDHDVALQIVLKTITDPTRGVVKKVDEIDAVGHRVVHGGEVYSGSVIIDDKVIEMIKDCFSFAPLHNPPNLMGIEACARFMPGVNQVAVFDTAFHQNMPPKAFIYALPYSMYEKHGIRRYGFHGTSHSFVAQKAAELLNRDYEKDFKVITCHLGNGASIAAVKNGVSVDTSMGFTPLEGLVMGTRCGDIDPAIIPYLMQKEDLSSSDIDTILNKQSGLKGISRTTNDMREILEEAEEGSKVHQLAFDVFCYRIKKYIGSYIAVLNGVDAIVFTGGIGEKSIPARKCIMSDMEWLGCEIDQKKNGKNETVISTGKVKVMVVPTDEELAIAEETQRVLQHKIDARSLQQEKEQLKKDLGSVSSPIRTQLAILWSQDQTISRDQLREKAKNELNLDLTKRIFGRLLKEMGINCK